MFARKCDRCGRLYENYFDVNGSAVYIFNRDDMGQALENEVFVKDLCPDCMDQFKNFMEGWSVIEQGSFTEFLTDRAKKEMYEAENAVLKAENERLKMLNPHVILDREAIEKSVKDYTESQETETLE